MKLVIVPNALTDAINAKIDAEIAKLPEHDREKAEGCRDHLFHQLLGYFDEYGVIPDCHIAANTKLTGGLPAKED